MKQQKKYWEKLILLAAPFIEDSLYTMDKPLEFILVPKCPLFGNSNVLVYAIKKDNSFFSLGPLCTCQLHAPLPHLRDRVGDSR